MRFLTQEKNSQWVVRRLNSIPQAKSSEENTPARTLAVLGALAGLLISSKFLFEYWVGSLSLADHISIWSALPIASTFVLLRFYRAIYWPGIWCGTWLLIALSAQLILEDDVAAVLFPALILIPVIFGMVVSARASAISTLAVCIIYLALSVLRVPSENEGAPDFQLQILIGACCAALCGVLVSYFLLYREKENAKLIKLREDLEKAVSIDPLTGVGNRRAFDQKNCELKLAIDQKLKPALLLFDVDKFKLINDTFGHAAGDHVLITLTQRIQRILEPGQLLFRLGGDEFAILVHNETDRENLTKVAVRTIHAVRKNMLIGGVSINVDLSIGIAMSEGDSSSISKLYSNADAASFHAKEYAGSKAIVFDANLKSKGIRRAELEAKLNAALAHKKIDIAFQPQVNIHTNEVVGFEALARWTDAELGIVNPDEFVRIAEESLLIEKFDRFIVAESLRRAKSWLGNSRKISINVSGRNIVSHEFCKFVLVQVDQVQIDPDQIELEITETFLIANWETCRSNLQLLRGAGLRIVLDDFGIGYSSLSYLSQFPVQKIKFDRSFLLQMKSSSSVAVMQTIVRLASALNMEVVAEGVDQSLQVNLLKKLRCNTVQGFFYSKPIPSNQMPGYVRRLNVGQVALGVAKSA